MFEKFQIRQVSGGLFSHLPPFTLPVNWPPKPPIWHLRNVELELLGSWGKKSQAPPCFAVRSGMEVRLSKRELVNDDLVALLADVVLVEKTVRMANLLRGSCTVGAKWLPRAPVRLPPHQGLRLPRSLTGPPFKRKFGGTSF